MNEHDYNIATHELYGYRHLDPIPTEAELGLFYADEYYENLENRAPDLDRFMGDTSDAETDWLSKVLWNDIYEIITYHIGGGTGKLLDYGCGTGHFLDFMSGRGWRTYGVEPSRKARKYATDNFNIIRVSDAIGLAQFDAITMLNVLEHVRDPEELINTVSSALPKQGVLTIRVPNDFSELQSAAKRLRGKNKQWWVKSPDHVNYFDFDSISKLLTNNGFYIADELGDFPMEFFIMFGDDYIDNPGIGKLCHEKRRNLELTLPTAARQAMYRDFASHDMGRNCLIFAIKE